MANRQINLGINVKANLAGLNQLSTKFKELRTIAQETMNNIAGNPGKTLPQMQQTINTVNTLESALKRAYNVKLNTINVEAFNANLKKSGLTVQQVYTDLSRLGVQGQQAFINLQKQTMTFNNTAKRTSATLQTMKKTMLSTIGWSITSSMWRTVLSSITKAYSYVKDMDSSLNDIRIVTGKSADSMERFAKEANRAAKELAVSTKDFVEGALIYYQQGLDDATVKALTTITAKTANVTGQTMEAVSEQLTAVWNGYQVANEAAKEGMQIYEEYIDKMAAVGATTASNLEELSTAMSKVASAAHSMGVGFDELNAQIATIVSVTRQAPESVGTALKTIYARLGDLQVDGVDEFGTKLGDVSSKLKTMGIDVIDANGNMKDMDAVMTEVAEKWNVWTDAQKQAAAVAMAGKRQYNNLIALFDNWDMYGNTLKTSMEASGTLSKQQGIALESLENKMDRMTATAQTFYDALFNADSIGGLIDGLTKILDTVGALTDGLGGLKTILPLIAGLLMKTFSGSIANGMTRVVSNFIASSSSMNDEAAKAQLMTQYKDTSFMGATQLNNAASTEAAAQTQKLVGTYQELAQYSQRMTEEEREQARLLIEKQSSLASESVALHSNLEEQSSSNELLKQFHTKLQEISKEELNSLQTAKTKEEKTKIENEALEKKKVLYDEINKKQQEMAMNIANMDQKISSVTTPATINTNIATNMTNQSLLADASSLQNMAIDQAFAGTGASNEAIVQFKNTLKEIPADTNYATVAIEEFKKALPKNAESQGIEQLKIYLNEYATASQNATNSQEILKNSLSQFFDEVVVAGAGLENTSGTVDILKNRFIELVSSGTPATEALEKISQEGLESGEIAKQTADKLRELADQMHGVGTASKTMTSEQAFKQSMQGISTMVGATTQTIMGLSGAINAINAAMDSSKTPAERLKASFMGLMFSLPMLYNGISSGIRALNSFKEAQAGVAASGQQFSFWAAANTKARDFLTRKTKENTAAEVENKIVKEADDATSQKEIVEDTGETLSENVKTNAVKQNTLTETENTIAQGAGEVVEDVDAGTDMAEVAGENAKTTATNANTLANYINATSYGALIIVIGLVVLAVIALIAIIVLVTNAIQKNQEKIENMNKEAERAAEKQKELTEEFKEQKTAIDELVTSYDELNKQYDEGEITLEELRSKTYDLCMQYEQQDLALQALMASYEELNNLMNNAQVKANDDLIESSKKEEEQLIISASTKMMATAKGTMRDYGHGNTFGDERTLDIGDSDIRKFLSSKYNIDFDNSGHMLTDEFAKAVAENYDEIYGFLATAGGKDAQELLKIIDESAESIERYQEVLQGRKDATKDKIVAQEIKGNIKTLAEYAEAYKKMYEAASQGEDAVFNNIEEAQEWARGQLMSNLEDNSLAISGQLASYIHEKTGKELDAIGKEIEKFTTEEQYFLYLQLKVDQNSVDVTKDYLDGIVKDYSDYIQASAYEKGVDVVGSLLAAEGKEELTEDEIDSLFNQKEFEEITGKNKEAFEAMDWLSQRAFMQQYYTQATNLLYTYKDQAYTQATDLRHKLEAEKEKYKTDNKDVGAFSERLENAGISATELASDFNAINITELSTGQLSIDGAVSENIKKLIADKLGKEVFELAEYEITYGVKGLYDEINAITDGSGSDGLVTTMNNYQEAITGYDDAITKAGADSNTFKNYQRDLNDIVAMNQGNMAALSTSLGNLKSTYDSLNSLVEDYNENGALSIDSLQTLLTLEDEQLMYLNYENGQMSINTDLMKQALIAKIQNAKATIWETTQEGLKAIAEGKTYEISTALIGTTDVLTDTTYKEADAVAADSQAWMTKALAMAEIKGTSTELMDDMAAFAESMRKQYVALTDFEEEASSADMSKLFDNDKTEKKIEEEQDRYWDLNNTLEETTNAIEELEEAQKHLHGEDLLKSIEKENELLNEQKEAYENIRKEQEAEAAELRDQLKNYGFSFENGAISNYKEATQGLVDAFNNNKIDEDTYEQVKENLDRYDELFYDEMKENEKKIDEITQKQIENNLEKFEAEVEMNLDTKEAERDWNDFMKDMSEDFKSTTEDLGASLDNTIKNFGTYFSQDSETGAIGGTIHEDLKAIETVQQELDKMQAQGENYDFSSGMFSSVGDAKEKLKELYETLREDASSAKELWKDAWDTYMDGIDQAADNFDDLSEKFDKINEELDYQKELIELLYGPEMYEMQDKIYKSQINNSLTQIDSVRQQAALWENMLQQTEEGTEDHLKYTELLNEAQSTLNDLTLEHIQLLKDEYSNTMNKIISDLEKSINGGLKFDDVKEEWEEAKEESEKYYDSVERIYELESLENKFQTAINKIPNTKYQQAIKDLMDDQLSTLKDKEELSEYDVQLAEKRLSILEAEAALEDAQNAKNAMKLVRGASGNWEYQYVADTSDIEAKQQDLRESYKELYDFAKEAQTDSIETLLEAKENYLTKMREIAESDELTEEEKQIKFAELNDKYWNDDYGIITQLQKDYNTKSQELSKISAETLLGYYKADEDAYYDMTEAEKTMIDQFKESVNGTYVDMYTAINAAYAEDQSVFDAYTKGNLETWQTRAAQMADAWNADEGKSVKIEVQKAYQAIMDATDEYQNKLDELELKSGDVFSKEGIVGDIDAATQATNNLKTATEEMAKAAEASLTDYKTWVTDMGNVWTTVVAPGIQTAIDKLKEYLAYAEIDVTEKLKELGNINGNNSGLTGDGNNGGPPGGEVEIPEAQYSFTGVVRGGLTGTAIAKSQFFTVDTATLKAILEAGRTADKEGGKDNEGSYKYQGMALSDSEISSLATKAGLGDLYKIRKLATTTNKKTEEKDVDPPFEIDDKVASAEQRKDGGTNQVRYYYKDIDGEMRTDWFRWGTTLDGQVVTEKMSLGGVNYYRLDGFKGIVQNSGWFREDQLVPFDTGGYTGDWSGGEGRMAMLHSKELILNKVDTENILNAVSAVRDLSGITGSIGSAIMGNLRSMLAEVLGISAGTGYETGSANNETSNVFNITAEFPNANDVTSIREAILSLPNLASQYIGRNIR